MVAKQTYLDGELKPWGEVKQLAAWDALLVGNGLSINVWPGFAYKSLFAEAALDVSERQTFELFNTRNFEEALKRLDDAILLNEGHGLDAAVLRAQRSSVADALGRTVVAVHPPRGMLDDQQLKAIYDGLRGYRWVFSTSYDLITYYAMASQEFKDVVDYFWCPEGAFDESTIWLHDAWNGTRMLYLHGAVHLVALSDGRNCKRSSSMWPLLDKFDRPHAGDEHARPLIVTEGASHQKVNEIDASCYLSFALRMLSERPEPLVIFGHSLGDQDEHLITVINGLRDRPIAVGLLDKGESSNRARKAEIHSRMPDLEIHFFDSATHPLGGEAVRAVSPDGRERLREIQKQSAGYVALYPPRGA